MNQLIQTVNDKLIAGFRRRLADVDALPQLALLGLLSGVFTGAVILLFRFAIEFPLRYFLPGNDDENYEDLAVAVRVLLPFIGAVLLGLLLHWLASRDRKVGVVHVMERLNYHQGYITFRSAVVQFVVGLGTILSGQSAGREGPAVHLGAAVSSLMGQWMRLPNNNIRTLVACGCAAAISASFNTPISGVIFAMEVVMMEYTIAGFTPIILAAVSAAIVTQVVYGSDPAFSVPALTMNSLLEIPWILAVAVVIAIAAASFIHILCWANRFSHRPIFLRILAAGILTMPFAALTPEIMGIGYDTVSSAIDGELTFWILLGAGLAKVVVTALTVGLGMPNSVIGPTIFMGATLGAAMGLIGAAVAPELASSVGFYAMLGMGAMMGAVLQAPLAALMALIELTRNPNIILPGMLVITTASLITSEVFGKRSVFLTMLQNQGLSYHNSPIIQALRRVSVGAIMDRSLTRIDREIAYNDARELLKSEPKWLVVEGSAGPVAMLPSVDLARFIEHLENRNAEDGKLLPETIDLMEMPAHRRDIAPVQYQATLEEALDQFEATHAEALYVQRQVAPMIQRIYGIVLRSDIESHYQYRRS